MKHHLLFCQADLSCHTERYEDCSTHRMCTACPNFVLQLSSPNQTLIFLVDLDDLECQSHRNTIHLASLSPTASFFHRGTSLVLLFRNQPLRFAQPQPPCMVGLLDIWIQMFYLVDFAELYIHMCFSRCIQTGFKKPGKANQAQTPVTASLRCRTSWSPSCCPSPSSCTSPATSRGRMAARLHAL